MNKILALLIILGAWVAEPVMAACNNLLDYDHRRLASQVEDNLCEAYGDTFPMFATSPVKGPDANALFAALED